MKEKRLKYLLIKHNKKEDNDFAILYSSLFFSVPILKVVFAKTPSPYILFS
jgi:hypothetical protein